MTEKQIDINLYNEVSEPPKQMLFDFFQDPNPVSDFQIYLYKRGWKIVPIEEPKV